MENPFGWLHKELRIRLLWEIGFELRGGFRVFIVELELNCLPNIKLGDYSNNLKGIWLLGDQGNLGPPSPARGSANNELYLGFGWLLGVELYKIL